MKVFLCWVVFIVCNIMLNQAASFDDCVESSSEQIIKYKETSIVDNTNEIEGHSRQVKVLTKKCSAKLKLKGKPKPKCKPKRKGGGGRGLDIGVKVQHGRTKIEENLKMRKRQRTNRVFHVIKIIVEF